MKITKKYFNQQQLNNIQILSEKLDLLQETVSILYSRGYDTEDKIEKFLNSGKQNFISPFLLKGVSEAVERITCARENGETVVIYGDYDADGICATTILYKCLQNFGIEAVTVIPERVNGYGLSQKTIDEIVENIFPDLLITVDCGISCHNEIEYLKDLGVDVIVTDHHELLDVLPDCITINCKIKEQEYNFDSLCGAGVAYKLGYALIGEKANNYLDLVALATVADSMPLIGENRDLVIEGLNIIKNNKSQLPIKSLMTISGMKDITANSLAYSLAPRVNAAGRMGDAYSALKLLTSDNYREIEELAGKLSTYNIERQSECEFIYKSVKAKLVTEGNFGKLILVSDENWNNGLIGITAAKITEEYYLPTIIISGNNGVYHGSARSIDGVNIFNAINSCKDLLLDFGGHAQAAGITIEKDKIQEFAIRLNEYISNNYKEEVFEKEIVVDGYVCDKFSMRLAREINSLEPFGVGNKKPLFATTIKNASAYPIKLGSTHIAFSNNCLDFMYFNGLKDLDVLNLNIAKDIVFEANISIFNNREYLKGYVKDFNLSLNSCDELKITALANYFESLITYNNQEFSYLSNEEMQGVIDGLSPQGFGSLLVLTNSENIDKFNNLKAFSTNVYKPSIKGGKNALLICDNAEENLLKEYNKVYLLDGLNFKNYQDKKVYVNRYFTPFNLSNVSVDREVFISVYNLLCNWANIRVKSLQDGILRCNNGFTYEQIVFSSQVFKELNFISLKGEISINKAVKKDLSESKIYTKIKELKGE